MGGITAALAALPYQIDSWRLATDVSRDVVRGDAMARHASEVDAATLATGPADADIFLGVAGEEYGGSASVSTTDPAGIDAKPYLNLWGRNVPVRIETGATVAYGDKLTLSSVTAGGFRKASAGEPVLAVAKKAITATATAFLAPADVFPPAAVGAVLGQPFLLNVRITDISTAASYWAVTPYAGTIAAVYTVLHGAITGANAVVTLELGGTLVTGSTVTITQSGSAAGDVDTASPSAANTVTAGQAIEVITDGGSTGTVPVDVTLVINRV